MIRTLATVLVFALASVTTRPGHCQPAAPGATPLRNLLGPDGFLRTSPGFTGSIDPSGWTMTAGENGVPRFVPATPNQPDPTDALWDDRFHGPGFDGVVRSVVVSGSVLYAAGYFTSVGATKVTNIAKLSGGVWSPVGSGTHFNEIADPYQGVSVSGVVNAMVMSGTDLYIAGEFWRAGGVTAYSVAKWDGTSWSPVGDGLRVVNYPGTGTVYALAVVGDDLYAAGIFNSPGGGPLHNIAKWDGANWSAVGSGTDYPVNALAGVGTTLYAGGMFSSIDGQPIFGIAQWDGSQWSAVGSGVNDGVSALSSDGTDLYVGGAFTTAGGVTAKGIAKWNGTSWSALGTGMSNVSPSEPVLVSSLTASSGVVYAGGEFDRSGGITTQNLARWNGSTWSAVGGGIPLNHGGEGVLVGLATLGTDLIVAGAFPIAGTNTHVYGLGRWNGSAWSATASDGDGILSGLGAAVLQMLVIDSELYVAGQFTKVGGVAANGIAKWNGTSWSALGEGVSGLIRTMVVHGADLYVGGTFDMDGTCNVARWDGSQWHPLALGLNNTVHGLTFVGDDLYACGVFTTAPFCAAGASPNHVARWNGTSWVAVGSGIQTISYPSPNPQSGHGYACAAVGNDLFVVGDFHHVGAVAAEGIARWNGTAWSAVGTPPNFYFDFYGTKTAMMVTRGTDLYVGAGCTDASGYPLPGLHKWDGSTWSSFPPGLPSNGLIQALEFVGTDVYVAGDLYAPGNTYARGVARWDGSRWYALGSGGIGINSLAAFDGDLYVGGVMRAVGAKQSFSFGRWSGIGEVLEPSFEASPVTFSFGNVTAGGFAQANLVVKNTGTGTLALASPTTVPGFGGHFIYPYDYTVVPGDSSNCLVVCYDVELGPHSAPLVFTHNALSSPDTVMLSYVGVLPVITATATGGGTIEPSGDVSVSVGADQTFTFTPGVGSLQDVIVDDVSIGGVDSSYTFTNVTQNHSIHAVFTSPDQAPAVTVTSPDGGETLVIGSLHDLTWTATDDHAVESVSLYVSRDDGQMYTPIATDVPNTGTYAWTVIGPGTNTTQEPAYTGRIRVVARDDIGQETADASDAGFAIQDPTVSVDTEHPRAFALSAARPSPSAGAVVVEYAVPHAAPIRLSVFDVQGREVVVLVKGWREPGRHGIRWDGRTAFGRAAAGLYFMRLTTPEQTFVTRLVLMR